MNHFKDMDVEVKNWNFAVGNADKEYTVEISLKPAKSQKHINNLQAKKSTQPGAKFHQLGFNKPFYF